MKLENLEMIMKLGRKREGIVSNIKNLKEKLVKLNECNKVKFMKDLDIWESICGNDNEERVVGIMSYDYDCSNFNKDVCKFVIDYFKNGMNNKIKELENELVNIDNELNKL